MVEASTVKRRAPSATRARAGHPWINSTYRPPFLPPRALREPSTAIDIALRLLWPNDLHRQAAACLGAAAETIRDWRRGRYPAPQWAIDKITTELDKRATMLVNAKAMLEKEKGRG